MSDPDPDLVVVSPTFHPEKVGTPHYVTDLVRPVTEAGASVAVVTNDPCYPEFRRHLGYGRRRRHDTLDGVPIRRLPTPVPSGGSAPLRAVSEVNMVLQAAFLRIGGRYPRSRRVLAVGPGVPFAALVGVFARRRGGRLVVVVHDVQTGLVGATVGPGGRLVGRVAGAVEAWALNRAEAVAPLSEAMGRELAALGVRVPVRVVPLWATVEPGLRPLPPDAGGVVMYSGNLGRKQGVETLVDVAEALVGKGRVVIRGEGSEKAALVRAVAARGLGNVSFEDLVDADRLPEALAAAAVHVVPQFPEGAAAAVPSKVFNILAVGRPVVVTAAPGTPLADLAEQTSAVRVVSPGDVDALAAEVIALLGDPARSLDLGRLAVDHVRRHPTRAAAVEAYLDLLERDRKQHEERGSAW